MIDLLGLQGNVVSKELTCYKIFMYGKSGCGKTTTASKFPDPLIVACERGYLTIPDVKAVDVSNWADILTVVNQLRQPKVKELYKNIVIDTVDELVAMLQEHILRSNGVTKPSEIPYGGYYSLFDTELRKLFRNIVNEGYGLVLIGHSKEKTFTDDDQFAGESYIEPSLDKRSKSIVDGLVDLQAYISREFDENGVPHSFLNFTPSAFQSTKTRFADIVPKVPLGYEELKKAMMDSIEKTAQKTNTELSTDNKNVKDESYTEQDFEEVKTKALELGQKYLDEGKAELLAGYVTSNLKNKKISETTIEDYKALSALVSILEFNA